MIFQFIQVFCPLPIPINLHDRNAGAVEILPHDFKVVSNRLAFADKVVLSKRIRVPFWLKASVTVRSRGLEKSEIEYAFVNYGLYN